jgi:hypothetical protein
MPIRKVSSVRIKDVVNKFDEAIKKLKEQDAKVGDHDGVVDKSETRGEGRKWFNRVAAYAQDIMTSGCHADVYGSIPDNFTYKELNELRDQFKNELEQSDHNEDGKVSHAAVDQIWGDQKTTRLFDLLAKETAHSNAPSDVAALEADDIGDSC